MTAAEARESMTAGRGWSAHTGEVLAVTRTFRVIEDAAGKKRDGVRIVVGEDEAGGVENALPARGFAVGRVDDAEPGVVVLDVSW